MFNKSIWLFIAIAFTGTSVYAQAPGAAIDVQHYTFALQLNDANNSIKGQATIDVKNLKSTTQTKLNLVKKNLAGKGMLVSAVTENGRILKFMQDADDVIIYNTAGQNSRHVYNVKYSGTPADGLIISTNEFGHRAFFGDNWPNRAHNWLPCVDDPADKASVEFIITAPARYQVIANGLKTAEQILPGGLKQTHWKETADLPTKVMVIGVAGFTVDSVGAVDSIPLYSYVFPESKSSGFKSYAVAKEILPFFIKKVGPYSYGKLANVQSKTIFGGMENAGAIFYYEESVNDPGIEALMAHEIAHQWFGDAVTEKSWADIWLSEGFATYMASIYLENKYGPDMLKRRLIKDREKIIAFEKKRLTPVRDTAVKSNYMQLLNANSYEKGSWILHMLRRKLSDELFWKGIGSYYNLYKGRNANTDDFMQVMQQASGQNLKSFFDQWLRTAGHPQLKIEPAFNAAEKTITIKITQQQDVPYSFPLTFTVNGGRHSVEIKEKETLVKVPANTSNPALVFDPDVDLLATFLY